nr:type III secretion system effector XopAI [Acidovorax sp. SUPP2539]
MGLCLTKHSGSGATRRHDSPPSVQSSPSPASSPRPSQASPHALSSRPLATSSAGMAPRHGLGALHNASPQALQRHRDQLMKRVLSEGSNFRSTREERAEFKAAYFAKYGREDAEYMWNETAQIMASVKAGDPALENVELDDLVALRMWTTGEYIDVQDVLESTHTPKPIGLAQAKLLISALHSLPDSYTHTGATVFTGETQDAQWVRARYSEGKVAVNQRFFATSETKEGAWQNMSVEWETQSLSGKRISAFSANPHEKEVLFPPGTRFRTDQIALFDGNRIKIHQSEEPS